jgi:GAF domain-containing protein
MRIELPLDSVAGIRQVVELGKPLIIPDLAADAPEANDWRARAHAAQRTLLAGARSWMAAPLLAKAEAIGALRLDHHQAGYFTEQHAELALAIANQTATAVENARLYQQAQQLAALEERQRLARDLHDSVAQTFYSCSSFRPRS